MRVLIAFDKFKHALSAQETSALAAKVVHDLLPQADVVIAPLSDGGEGFVDILTNHLGGSTLPVEVTGPRGATRAAHLGLVPLDRLPPGARTLLELPDQGTLAIVEMAQASGLDLIPPAERDPWQTTSRGTGDLIAAATHAGAHAILLGIGGSATNDLGLGALEALGLFAYDHHHQRLPDLRPVNWRLAASLGGLTAPFHKLPPIRIACDVGNPLLGPHGATATFGPQKGLPPEDIGRLDRACGIMARRLLGFFGLPLEHFEERLNEPGSGGAGGLGFGLRAASPRARFVPGFDLVYHWLGLEDTLASVDLVITGEGRFDQTSLQGKGPGRLAETARPGARCLVFAGAVDLPEGTGLPPSLARPDIIAISPQGLALDAALAATGDNLRQALHRHLRENFSRG